MGTDITMRRSGAATTLCVEVLLLLGALLAQAKGPKKKKGGGDGNAAMVECQSTFEGLYVFEGNTNNSELNAIMAPYSEATLGDDGYNVTLQNEDPGYVGADYSQVIDEWGTYLLDDYLRGACEELDLSGTPYPRGESRTTLFEDDDGNALDGPHYHHEYDTNDTAWDSTFKMWKYAYDKETYTQWPAEHTYQQRGLPYASSPCNPDDNFPTCAQYEPDPFECTVRDVSEFLRRIRAVYSMVADDCWTVDGINYPTTQSQCLGAPRGAQTCNGTALDTTRYPVGLHVTVNGDRCTACSLKADLCPGFYDVHTCSFEWTYSEDDVPTSTNTTFSFGFTVNSGHKFGPAALLLCLLITVVLFIQQL